MRRVHLHAVGQREEAAGQALVEGGRGALRSLGLAVSDVRTGKEIVVTFDAEDEPTALEAVSRMGRELLANPVIEQYEFSLNKGVPA